MKPSSRPPLARRRHVSGFTLLEAIVALTIVGITLVPVMSFLINASQQLRFAADSNQRAASQRTALAYIETMNPLSDPEGKVDLSERVSLRWASTTLAEPNSQARLGARLGAYRIGFFLVTVTVVRGSDEWFSFEVRKIGYQLLASPMMPGTSP